MNDTIKPFLDEAIDRLGDRYRGLPETARNRLEPPIWHAYQQGRHDALSGLMSMRDLEIIFPETPRRTLQDIRKRLDLGMCIGSDRVTVYTASDVESIRGYLTGREERGG